jgi:hypothetical protein
MQVVSVRASPGGTPARSCVSFNRYSASVFIKRRCTVVGERLVRVIFTTSVTTNETFLAYYYQVISPANERIYDSGITPPRPAS